jgi:tight adherence protein C
MKRIESMENSLPVFADLLIVAVEAGISIPNAIPILLEEVGTKKPLEREFQVLYNEYTGGLSLREVCERMMKRCDSPSLSNLLGNVIQSDQMGTSMGYTLRVIVKELREKKKQKIREKAMKIPALVAPPLFLIFASIFILTIGPSFFTALDLFAKVQR